MTKTPNLSKAQAAAWELVLEWYALDNRGEYFLAGGLRKYEYVAQISVPGTVTTFDALVKKGMLEVTRHPFHKGSNRYTIHPDYLPTAPASDTQDAAPEIDKRQQFNEALDLLDDAMELMSDVLAKLREVNRKAPRHEDWARGYVYNYLLDIATGESKSLPAWRNHIERELDQCGE